MRTIQGILGRGACPRRELLEKGDAVSVLAADAQPARSPELAEAA